MNFFSEKYETQTLDTKNPICKICLSCFTLCIHITYIYKQNNHSTIFFLFNPIEVYFKTTKTGYYETLHRIHDIIAI